MRAHQQVVKAPSPSGRGWISRRRLLRALKDASDKRLVLVDAPVGYGKSTLLAQWREAEQGRRSFAWLALTEQDSDPTRLLAHLVASLRQVAPGFGATVEPALGVPGAGPSNDVLPRVLDGLAALPPVVLVLDDYHHLRGRDVHGLMARLLAGLPPTGQLAIACRADPPLPLGRLRAAGAMSEVRADALRFTEEEARRLLASSHIALDPADLSTLVERTEGWPAGIYLATLSLRSEQDPSGFVRRFAGTHRHIADYLSEEVFRRQPAATRKFLICTSGLERMCAELCDAVIDGTESQAMLERLDHSNLFVLPLDDDRRWYRYHHLFAQMLRAELSRREPELALALHRRASAWFEAEGWHEEAVAHALAGRDAARSAELVARYWLELFNDGRLLTVRGWLEEMGDDAIAAHPAAALTAGWVAALDGELEAMKRWLAIAELGTNDGPLPDGTASLESGVAIIRGLFGHSGLEARRANLARALDLEATASAWRPWLLWGMGHVALLSGDPTTANGLFCDVLRVADPRQAVLTIVTLAELAIAEANLGDTDAAMIHARRAEMIANKRGLISDPRSSSVWLALGYVLVVRGDVRAGHKAMERALRLRRSAPRLSPWPTLEVLLALAPVRLTLGDPDGAAGLLAEARTMLADLPDAGDLHRRLEDAERQLRGPARRLAFGQALTDRELAILKLFPSPLSQRDIGGELFLSLNTVKSHSRAIYRKLGVSSRERAIERARELALL
ncbi:MAG: LuxR C-terminal-related transcriptional regulator [Acidimicrobiales bacterium]